MLRRFPFWLVNFRWGCNDCCLESARLAAQLRFPADTFYEGCANLIVRLANYVCCIRLLLSAMYEAWLYSTVRYLGILKWVRRYWFISRFHWPFFSGLLDLFLCSLLVYCFCRRSGVIGFRHLLDGFLVSCQANCRHPLWFVSALCGFVWVFLLFWGSSVGSWFLSPTTVDLSCLVSCGALTIDPAFLVFFYLRFPSFSFFFFPVLYV